MQLKYFYFDYVREVMDYWNEWIFKQGSYLERQI